MGRKSRKYDSRLRHISSKSKSSDTVPVGKVPSVEFAVDESKYDEANAVILTDRKTVKKKSSPTVVKKKILSKKQKKKLEQIVKRKQKKEDRATILSELAKHRISSTELEAIRSATQSSKRQASNNDLDDDSCGGKKRRRRKKSLIPESETPRKTRDLSVVQFGNESESEVSSSEEEEEEIESQNEEPTAEEPESCCIPADVTTNETIHPSRNPSPVPETSGKTDALKAAESLPTIYVSVNRTKEAEESRLKLPILAEEQGIIEAIRYNNVVIICGETGSGKTTQVPQFLYEAGYAVDRKIGVTEPRRVAAISMSYRVAHEMNLSTDIVSYQVRYDTNQTNDSKIKFMTDGILLKELQEDFLLSSYSVIIIDEAHERSVFSDILIGMLSRIVNLREKREDRLRLIIMSATLRVESFAENPRLFPQKPPVLRINSRQFPVTIHFAKITPENYLESALTRVCKIHRSSPPGGILVFVTGRQEVETLCRKLRKKFSPGNQSTGDEPDLESSHRKKKRNKIATTKVAKDQKLHLNDFSKPETLFADEPESDDDTDLDDINDDDHIVLSSGSCDEPLHCVPLYSMLPKSKQENVFKKPPPGHRLCVIATNIAETSLTIPDIKYVVDTGKVKTKVYNKTTGVSSFIIDWCSKSSADQRAGRAGRTSAGHCFRLYSSAVFTNHFPAFTEPEIKLKPIDDLVLQMKSLSISNVLNFPFPTPPSEEALIASEKRLIQMGALEEVKTSVSVHGRKATRITRLGRAMSHFPVSPRYAMMFAYAYNDILPYVIALVAGLTVQEIFLFAGEKNEGSEKVDFAKQRAKWLALRKRWSGVGDEHLLGDLMVILKAIGASEYAAGSHSFSYSNGISHKAMFEVHRLRKQLTSQVNRLLQLKDSDLICSTLSPPTQTSALHLRQIALVGFFDHVARRADESVETGKKKSKLQAYQSVQVDQPVFIDDASVLRDENPEFVVYQELHESSKMVMRNVVAIEASWLAVYAPQLCTLSQPLQDPSPFYDLENDCVMAFVSGSFGPYSWPIPVTAVPYPDNEDLYKWFATFLLQGLVDKRFEEFNQSLLSHPRILFKSWIRLQPAMLSIANALRRHQVRSLADLKAEWLKNPNYLAPEYMKWLPEHLQLKAQQIFDGNKTV